MADWSPLRVGLICAAWVFGAPALALLGFYAAARVVARLDVTTPAYFRFDLAGWPAAALLFAPPALLVGAWLYARWAGP